MKKKILKLGLLLSLPVLLMGCGSNNSEKESNDKLKLTFRVKNEEFTDYRDLIYHISNQEPGNYVINYIISYNNQGLTLNQNVTIKKQVTNNNSQSNNETNEDITNKNETNEDKLVESKVAGKLSMRVWISLTSLVAEANFKSLNF